VTTGLWYFTKRLIVPSTVLVSRACSDRRQKCRHRVTICLHIAQQLRLVVTEAMRALGDIEGTSRSRAADVLGGNDGHERRFCGGMTLLRQAFGLVVPAGSLGRKLTDGCRSGNIRMLYVRLPEAALKGLMASCDIFGERSMQYGTYASASS
jgi:hypothetical protein